MTKSRTREGERKKERKREKEKEKERERERGWDKKESVIDEKNHLKEGKKLTESEANNCVSKIQHSIR